MFLWKIQHNKGLILIPTRLFPSPVVGLAPGLEASHAIHLLASGLFCTRHVSHVHEAPALGKLNPAGLENWNKFQKISSLWPNDTNQYSWVPLCRSAIYHNITYNNTMTAAEHKSDLELTKRHPMSHPYGWAMGCLLWGFGRKLITSTHCTTIQIYHPQDPLDHYHYELSTHNGTCHTVALVGATILVPCHGGQVFATYLKIGPDWATVFIYHWMPDIQMSCSDLT